MASGGREIVWSWYVVAQDTQKETHIYEIVKKSTDRVPQMNGQLRLPIDQIGLSQFKPKELEVEVSEILRVFFNIPDEYGVPIQLDRMWGGTPDSVKKPAQSKTKRLIRDILVPTPQTV